MSITTSDPELELQMLYTLCEAKDQKIQHELIATLTRSHFSTEMTDDVFARCSTLLKTKGFIPSWSELCVDPALTRSNRKVLKRHKLKVLGPKKRLSSLTLMEEFRKIRTVIDLGVRLQEDLEKSKFNIEETMTNLLDGVSRITEGSEPTRVFHIGEGDNSTAMVKALLKSKGENIIPTGFRGFDDINRGWTKGSSVMLVGTTGSGKSVLAGQVCENIGLAGGHVGIVPLEMTTEENMVRNLARISQVDSLKLLNPVESLSESQRKAIYHKYKEYSKRIANNGGRITTLEPSFAPQIDSLLAFVDSLDLDVLIIDYVGLMEGANAENQAKVLSEITAKGKRWAARTGRVIVFCAQLSADGLVRYSRAMEEHANYCWTWQAPEDRESGIVTIIPTKARMARMFDFNLKFDYARMTVRDPTEQEMADHITMQKDQQQEKWGKSKKAKSGKVTTEPDEKYIGKKPKKRKKDDDSDFTY